MNAAWPARILMRSGHTVKITQAQGLHATSLQAQDKKRWPYFSNSFHLVFQTISLLLHQTHFLFKSRLEGGHLTLMLLDKYWTANMKNKNNEADKTKPPPPPAGNHYRQDQWLKEQEKKALYVNAWHHRKGQDWIQQQPFMQPVIDNIATPWQSTLAWREILTDDDGECMAKRRMAI